MQIKQSHSFEKNVKKLSEQEKKALDDQVRKIAAEPDIGDEKKGDLSGVYVHKFKIKTTQYLIAYRHADESLELIMIGPHENRDLKNYLSKR